MVDFSQLVSQARSAAMIAVFSLAFSATFAVEEAEAQRYAAKERKNAAVGHYARARSMMVEALKEFEQGRRLARPDLLLDSEDFRLKLISLTEDLNRVIDPKPRITRDGAVFRANPRMVRRERDSLPPIPGGPQDSNVYGEQQRLQELEQARARLYQEQQAAAAKQENKADSNAFVEEQQTARPADYEDYEESASEEPPAGSNDGYEAAAPYDSQPEAVPAEEEDDALYEEEEPAAELSAEGRALSQDQQIANAIEQEIQKRIQNLELGAEPEGYEDDGQYYEGEE